jgi:hypothetical protein
MTLTVLSTAVRQLGGLYSLNDLHAASGGEKKHEPHQFMRLDQTQALIAEINSADSRISHKIQRGGQGGTYVCRELVYAYAMWISPRFNLAVIRAFDAGQAKTAPAQKALPSRAEFPHVLRQAINRKAHALSLESFDRIRDTLLARVRDYAARGDSEAAILERINHPSVLIGDMHLIQADDLWAATAWIASAKIAIEAAEQGIHKLEQQTGRQWYGRPPKEHKP